MSLNYRALKEDELASFARRGDKAAALEIASRALQNGEVLPIDEYEATYDDGYTDGESDGRSKFAQDLDERYGGDLERIAKAVGGDDGLALLALAKEIEDAT